MSSITLPNVLRLCQEAFLYNGESWPAEVNCFGYSWY